MSHANHAKVNAPLRNELHDGVYPPLYPDLAVRRWCVDVLYELLDSRDDRVADVRSCLPPIEVSDLGKHEFSRATDGESYRTKLQGADWMCHASILRDAAYDIGSGYKLRCMADEYAVREKLEDSFGDSEFSDCHELPSAYYDIDIEVRYYKAGNADAPSAVTVVTPRTEAIYSSACVAITVRVRGMQGVTRHESVHTVLLDPINRPRRSRRNAPDVIASTVLGLAFDA